MTVQPQRDMLLHGDHIEFTRDPRLHIRHIKLSPIIGIGYWKDVYKLPGVTGHTHNIIFPFVRIQVGFLEKA